MTRTGPNGDCPSCGAAAPASTRSGAECVRPVETEEALAAFARAHPRYADTAILDELRAREYARLDRRGHVYLDYTGGGLYAESQLREHLELLRGGVFGNPHSTNPTSLADDRAGRAARARRVLEFFRASPDEYAVIFTAERQRRAQARRRVLPVRARRRASC